MNLTPLQEAIIKENNKTIEEFLRDVAESPSPLQPIKDESLAIMEATAMLYEANLALEVENVNLKEDNLATMEALADVYEMMLF